MSDYLLVALAALLGILLGVVTARLLRTPVKETKDDTLAVRLEEAAILATFQELALVVGPDDSVLWANDRAVQFGLTRQDQLVHDELMEMVQEARRTGEEVKRELELSRGITQKGNISLAAAAAPLSRRRVLILGRDETARRRLEETRRDFVINVSHELKTPVGAISLLAETISEATDEPEVVARFAKKIRREAGRLSTLVQAIIELARLEQPDALADSTVVNIDAVIADAADRMNAVAEDNEITLVVGPESRAQVIGSEDLLSIAVRNLLDNAIKYSSSGSRVSIGVSVSNGMVHIAVVDKGIGIPVAAQARVFERFYRVDSARSRKTGGSGLGLSIVKHIAADHGGEVSLWSQEGQGSTFTLSIPEYLPHTFKSLTETPDAEGTE